MIFKTFCCLGPLKFNPYNFGVNVHKEDCRKVSHAKKKKGKYYTLKFSSALQSRTSIYGIICLKFGAKKNGLAQVCLLKVIRKLTDEISSRYFLWFTQGVNNSRRSEQFSLLSSGVIYFRDQNQNRITH